MFSFPGAFFRVSPVVAYLQHLTCIISASFYQFKEKELSFEKSNAILVNELLYESRPE